MNKRFHGFTLIELLVVVAIIGLLVAILLPAMNRARATSRRAGCRANLHTAAMAFQAYLIESLDRFPVASMMPSEETDPAVPRIADVLRIYLGNPEVLKCPADTVEKDDGKTYFVREGASYEYVPHVKGKLLSELQEHDPRTFVMFDYEGFHGTRYPDDSEATDELGAINFLFIDGSVGDLE